MLSYRCHILSFVLTVCSLCAEAQSEYNADALRDSLENALQHESSVRGKMSTLYNIFDLSIKPRDKVDALSRLYQIAEQYDRAEVQLDVMTHLANILRDDKPALDSISKELTRFVVNDRSREVKLFVDMSLSDYEARNDSANNLIHLENLIRSENEQIHTDPYEHAVLLYSLCTHLGKTTSGVMLQQYIERLEDVIESLPLPAGSVRNLIYTRAAPVFTRNFNYAKAVDIDKKMINIIDSLNDSYHQNGRPYRDFDVARYNCYRRLLANHKGLRQVEIESIHDKINELAKRNRRIELDMKSNEQADIFYFLASEKYHNAVAALKRQVDNKANAKYRTYMLNALVEAAEKINDYPTQLNAAVELNKLLRQELRDKSSERYRELEILYNVNTLQHNIESAESQDMQTREKVKLFLIILFSVAMVLLIVLMIIIVRSNRRYRRLVNRLETTADRLRQERADLKEVEAELIKARDDAASADKLKSDFINTMSHEVKVPLSAIMEYSKLIVDCVPDDQSAYLERFANIIESNCKLIMTLINDVLDIAALEHGVMTFVRKPTGAQEMCSSAIDTLFEDPTCTSKGVEIVADSDESKDFLVDTDPQRVVQILTNLLDNASKFTDEGSITIESHRSADGTKAIFTVTDTGTGIPEAQKENIFTSFTKLDSTKPGCGMGLYISRHVARLLNGDLYVDTTYHGGARLVLEIPIR